MIRLVRNVLKTIAALAVFLLLSMLAGIVWPLDVPVANERVGRVLFTGVSLVDVEQGVVKADQRILIDGDEIVAVGADLDGGGSTVIEMGGLFAIPGMFDMHVHNFKMAPALMHPLFIAAGVTAVRDLGGCLDLPDSWVACAGEKRSWNELVASAAMVGPRFDQITGLAIDGGREIPDRLDRALGAGTADGAGARVAYDKARGLDFLKPYTMLPREGFFALAESARENGLYLAGHLPLAVGGLEAVAAGQRSFEHAFLFIWECYPGMAALRDSADPRSVYTDELRLRMIEAHDAGLCSALHDAMRVAGTAFVPTHTTRKLDAFATDERYRNDARLAYIPAPLRTMWLQDADGMAARAADGNRSYRAFYEFGLEQTGIAHRAGVTVLAGTDTPDSFAFPGFGLHDELEHLVEAGLSPTDALRAATLAPAAFLGLADRAGALVAGARADIVFLDANPLADIRAVREIDSVVLAGAVYSRADLDAMLAGVKRAAGSWTMWPKFAWQILRSPIMMKQFAD